jgi:3D (Asp-Asp-Asp) domain-containing protein
MNTILKIAKTIRNNALIASLISAPLIWGSIAFFGLGIELAKANPFPTIIAVNLAGKTMAMTQENSLLAVSTPYINAPTVSTMKVIITAYSSTIEQTDDSPFITASGKTVEDGIVANNLLPFGAKIRIPEVFGDKIFTVEDRMNQRKGYYHVDVWFPEYNQAKEFGAKISDIEILGN